MNFDTLKLDFNYMLDEYIGDFAITKQDILDIMPKISSAKDSLQKKRNLMQWRDLPYTQDDIIQEILDYVNSVKNDFDAFVLLGIGGSALGPLATFQAIAHPFYNDLPKDKRNNFPKFYVLDNVDPEKLGYIFDVLDPTKCLFNVVSKSGSTSETMSQFMIIKDLLESKLGKNNISKHIVCTTDKENGNLIKIANSENYKTFYIPSGVGGRFSQLCPVGLLPAAMCNIDIKKFLQGACHMDNLCKSDDIYKNPAYMFAILNYLSIKKNKNIVVMMPYADSLKYISDWFCQLWAESLGKKYNNQNIVVNTGQTPVKALGATDQHSQVQLYTEGPNDKIIVFLGVSEFRKDVKIPKIYEDIKSLGFLGGITQSQLIQAEQIATEYALLKSGKSSMTITLPKIDEFTLGQLIYMLEVATAFAGELLDINAFDQPGVEEGKDATYAYFGRPGYEQKKSHLENMPKKNTKYII